MQTNDMIDCLTNSIVCRFVSLKLFLSFTLYFVSHDGTRGAQFLTGENLKVVWAEFSTLS